MIQKTIYFFVVIACVSISRAQNWTHVGPLSTNLEPVQGQPNLFETGQINLLEINPWNSQNLVCGGIHAGLWQSSNGGSSWTRIATESLGSNGVGSIHFVSKDVVLVTNRHLVIGGIKKSYSEGIALINLSNNSVVLQPKLPIKACIIHDATVISYNKKNNIFLATSEGLFVLDEQQKIWIQLTHEPVQSLKTHQMPGDESYLLFSGTDPKTKQPKVNLIKLRDLFAGKLEFVISTLLPVYTNDILRSNSSTIQASHNKECLVESGEKRSPTDFDLFLLSDQEVFFDRKNGADTKAIESYHLMLYKIRFSNGALGQPEILHHDTHLSSLTGARTGLVYDSLNRGIWFSGVRLHFAFDPTISSKKYSNIRSGFKTGKGLIHDDIHELRIYTDKGKRYLIAACDGGIARSELPTFSPDEQHVAQKVYFDNLNHGLHVMLVNGFSGASKNPNFYVVGGFDITNTDFFRADLGRNEHTESTWENAGALIDLFDNSRVILDVSMYSQFYRVAQIDSDRKYQVSENRTFYSPLQPGVAPIRANKQQMSPSHNEIIGFQPRNFVQDPYRPGRIFYVKHKVGLHQLDLEAGLFVRKLDLAELNPEPEWAGWSNDWRWWRSVSFSPQTPNSMHIIINGSDNPENKIQNPMIIKYTGTNLDACFGLDHTRTQDGIPQWRLISERFFNRFNRYMGTQLSRDEIQKIDLIDIATSPTNRNKIYVMMRSKEASAAKIALFTGTRWLNYGAGLPNDEYAMAMVLDYKTNDGIYLATDKNIYYRDASMQAWICVSGNFPKLNVEQLEINYLENTLRAGTFGLGIWKMPLYKTPTETEN